MSKNQKPIIVKKYLKKTSHVHHGGTWKIAYADFVTAMMAFFMLMWLINSITMEQKKGIADYFTPNITKIQEDELPEPMEDGEYKPDAQELNLPGYAKLIQVKRNLENSMQENPELRALRKHVNFHIAREGLSINIVDNYNKPMFVPGSAEMMEPMKILLKEVTSQLNLVDNIIRITGHTDSINYTNTREYTNWELSIDRANKTRQTVEEMGVNMQRIYMIEGRADRSLLNAKNPSAPENRRVTITLIR